MAFTWTILWLGCLTLSLAPVADSATESTTTTAPKMTHETPAVDLGALLDAGEGAVVMLVAGDTRLVAHRAVLTARSPHFKAMLSNNTLEANSGQLDISDVEGPVLRQLVAYLYTLQAPQLSSTAPQLLAAADTYGVSGLKAACERQLVAQLAVENAASLAALAVRHSCPRLREAAVAFLRANLFAVMATQGWAREILSHPKDMIVVMQLLAEPPAATSTVAATEGGSSPEPQPHTDNSQTTPASTPATAASSTSAPGGGPVSPYSTLTATDGGSAPGQTRSGSSQTPAASTPAPPACNAPLPDDDKVSCYRSLSAAEKGRRLIEAAKEGAAGEVRALLAAGADVGARDEDMYTALHWAAREGHEEAARRLLLSGAEVDARGRWQQWTPLHEAAYWGHVAVARLLLEAGADVNARSLLSATPLHHAAEKGHAAVVRLLAAAGADLNARRETKFTPLHSAALRGHAEAAAALLEAGADRGATDIVGDTPLALAKHQNHKALVDLLTWPYQSHLLIN